MFPQADVPVTQLSLARNASPAAHFALGQALAPLRDEGVLILATGSITHNFGWLDWHAADGQAPLPQAQAFADWVAARAAARDVTALLDYRAASHGAAAHPTEEHFLPFFVALGAADGDLPTRYRPPFAYGGLAMDAYVWQATNQTF
jgi:4,5-DOPA dioxygenase extradiol